MVLDGVHPPLGVVHAAGGEEQHGRCQTNQVGEEDLLRPGAPDPSALGRQIDEES